MMSRPKNPLYLHGQWWAYSLVENARSFSAKLDLVFQYDLGGIAVWRLGQEDP